MPTSFYFFKKAEAKPNVASTTILLQSGRQKLGNYNDTISVIGET